MFIWNVNDQITEVQIWSTTPKKVLFESLDSDKDGKLNFNEINSGTDIGKEKVRLFSEGCNKSPKL